MKPRRAARAIICSPDMYEFIRARYPSRKAIAEVYCGNGSAYAYTNDGEDVIAVIRRKGESLKFTLWPFRFPHHA